MASRRWFPPALLLGFALGGFFDGILLHQILEWHHLLSLVPGVVSLRAQLLWDGYFHALMYGLAAFALAGLMRRRRDLVQVSGTAMIGAVLIGFGLWHVVDGLLSHWLLGIHRIRIDSADPLVWDLIWFAGFGLVPIVLGAWLLRRNTADEQGPASLLMLGLITAGLSGWSLQEPPGQGATTLVLAPWARPVDLLTPVLASGGGLVWANLELSVLVVRVPAAARAGLYARGALLVSGSGVPAGCAGWTRI